MRAVLSRVTAVMTLAWICAPGNAGAQSAPHDLWTPAVLQKIRDKSTLQLQLIPRAGHFEVFFDSEASDAKWADAEPPYAIHRMQTIRIHGYFAAPSGTAPRPAVVLGHGHGRLAPDGSGFTPRIEHWRGTRFRCRRQSAGRRFPLPAVRSPREQRQEFVRLAAWASPAG
jgi:hypothetical protein